MDNEKIEQDTNNINSFPRLNLDISPKEQPPEKKRKGTLVVAILLTIAVVCLAATLIIMDILHGKDDIYTDNNIMSYTTFVEYDTDKYDTIINETLITSYADYIDLLYEIGGDYQYEYDYIECSPKDEEDEDIWSCDENDLIKKYETSTSDSAPLLLSEFDIAKDDFDNYDFVSFIFQNDYCGGGFNRIRSVNLSRNNIDIEVGYDSSCGPCAMDQTLVFVPIEKGEVSKNAEISIDTVLENKPHCNPNVSYKPIIYLYPETKTKINVKLGNPDLLTTTYPKYDKETGWNVTASPDGNLASDGKNYYGLYWEGLNEKSEQKDEGFVVVGKDVEKFLEEKLEILGLNEREANEFIIYWLPKLEHNEWNYIRFATNEEIEDMMPLEISPKPETIIRILMEYKPLETPIELKEQELKKVERKGYTAVEWGGTELKEEKTH